MCSAFLSCPFFLHGASDILDNALPHAITVHLVSFVCLRAWTGSAGKGAGFGSTKGGGGHPPPFGGGWGSPPPLQPPKLSNTPRGHTLAGGRPRGNVPTLPTNGRL